MNPAVAKVMPWHDEAVAAPPLTNKAMMPRHDLGFSLEFTLGGPGRPKSGNQ